MKRVLIVPDKFKGTITAANAAKAIARGWKKARPQDHLTLLPMSDGGDGFGEAIALLDNAVVRRLSTVDAAGRPIRTPWWWIAKSRTAIVECARVVGLAHLPPGKYHPFELDTHGLGQVLEKISATGARRCLIGLGGSATNDGGFGMARAIGWRFLDSKGGELTDWTDLSRCAQLEPPSADKELFQEVIAAVDVQNLLLGKTGASRIYGPQKGLASHQIPHAERYLKRLANLVARHLGNCVDQLPGSGAAGGLGFGVVSFLNGRIESGFHLFASRAKLFDAIDRADLVITGEGSIDRSSIMGKGVGEIANRCCSQQLPCIGIGGVVENRRKLVRVFTQIHAIAPDYTNSECAVGQPGKWLARIAKAVAQKVV